MHISYFQHSKELLEEFNKVFSFNFISNTLQSKPTYDTQLVHCLEDISYKDTTVYLNYSDMFMHEIFNFITIRKYLKAKVYPSSPQVHNSLVKKTQIEEEKDENMNQNEIDVPEPNEADEIVSKTPSKIREISETPEKSKVSSKSSAKHSSLLDKVSKHIKEAPHPSHTPLDNVIVLDPDSYVSNMQQPEENQVGNDDLELVDTIQVHDDTNHDTQYISKKDQKHTSRRTIDKTKPAKRITRAKRKANNTKKQAFY